MLFAPDLGKSGPRPHNSRLDQSHNDPGLMDMHQRKEDLPGVLGRTWKLPSDGWGVVGVPFWVVTRFWAENIWVWVNIKPPGYGPQILVHLSIYQGNPFWVPSFDPQPYCHEFK